MKRLEGRVVVVTGAASGIGAATVERLLGEGAGVVGWDLAAGTGPGGTSVEAVDVTDEAAVAAAVGAAQARHGRLDGLVNAAGVLGDAGRIGDLSLEAARRTYRINAEGTLITMQAVLPLLTNHGGAIVNVASEAGLRARVGVSPYAASKAAVISYSRTAAREYGRHGVRVNAVCPGGTMTPMMADADERTLDEIRKTVPLGRFAEPTEIAAVVAFALSDDASYMTGATLVVDGGLLA